MKKYNLCIGSSMIDIFGFSPNASNLVGCNPGSVKIAFGGVSRNIVENMLRIHIETKFISVFGDDLYGQAMIQQLKDLGCDLSLSITSKQATSASFMAIVDESRHILRAIADNSIMGQLTIDYLIKNRSFVENAEFVIFDVNDYGLYEAFIHEFKNVKVIIDPVSPMKASKIKHLLPNFHTIKPNRKEAEVLCGLSINNEVDLRQAGRFLISKGIKHIFITLDKDGVYFTNGDEEGIIKATNVPVVNEVGAGDAFVAGIVYGYHHQYSFIETIKFAYSMAIMNLSSEQTVNQEVNIERVIQKMNQQEWLVKLF